MNATLTAQAPILTKHVRERIAHRLSAWITQAQVEQAVSGKSYRINGQTYVLVCRLPRTIVFNDGGTTITGNAVFAVVDREDNQDPGRVVTVMVRHADNQPTFFRPRGMVKQHVRAR